MNDNFKKIKRKALIVRLLKSLLVGGAVALPVIGALLLLARFERITLETVPIVLIGCAAGLVTGICVLLLLWRSDKRIAMLLDRKYHLNEKVQTMLAFKDRQGDPMVDLQRSDANAALDSVRGAVPGVGRIWIYLLCLLLGAGLFIGSLFFQPVPPPEPEPEPEVPYQVTEMQLAALAELIESVRGSEMESPYREGVVAALETLDTEIRLVTTVNGKDEVVSLAMEEILRQTDDSSETVEIVNALWQTGGRTARQLAKALNYYEWGSDNAWEVFMEGATDFRISFDHADAMSDDPDEALMAEETKNVYVTLAQAILLSLQQTETPADRPLAAALDRLVAAKEENADGTRVYGLQFLAEYIVQNGYVRAQRELDATLAVLNGDLFRALSVSNINTDTGERAVTAISGLFDVPAPAFERPVLSESHDPDAPGEEGGGSGGIGGGPSYGSDDKVYDPFTNRYVEYGAILDKYYEIMFGHTQSGDYTDEEKKALEEYFKILYGGFEQEGDQIEE